MDNLQLKLQLQIKQKNYLYKKFTSTFNYKIIEGEMLYHLGL